MFQTSLKFLYHIHNLSCKINKINICINVPANGSNDDFEPARIGASASPAQTQRGRPAQKPVGSGRHRADCQQRPGGARSRIFDHDGHSAPARPRAGSHGLDQPDADAAAGATAPRRHATPASAATASALRPNLSCRSELIFKIIKQINNSTSAVNFLQCERFEIFSEK